MGNIIRNIVVKTNNQNVNRFPDNDPPDPSRIGCSSSRHPEPTISIPLDTGMSHSADKRLIFRVRHAASDFPASVEAHTDHKISTLKRFLIEHMEMPFPSEDGKCKILMVHNKPDLLFDQPLKIDGENQLEMDQRYLGGSIDYLTLDEYGLENGDFLIFLLKTLISITEAIPRTDVTVSGLSSGAAMTAQLHLVFSSTISGSGILAGPPYRCAQGDSTIADTLCLYGPASFISVETLLDQLQSYVTAGLADPTSNLINDPVYIFSGRYDPVVLPDVVKLNGKIFSSFTTNIKTNYRMKATHGYITDNFGGLCELPYLEYFINNCSFNLAYDVLNHIFGGNLTKPTKSVPLTGQFVIIEQPAFMNPELINVTDWKKGNIFSYWANWLKTPKITYKLPGSIGISLIDASGFDREGFVYYPTNCTKGQKCPIHVALHGCLQGKWRIGDVFAKKTGYLEVAELNNIIILFPQINATLTDPSNSEGCWDWWGYGSPNYANKLGTQMAGVKKMIDSLRAINAALND